MITIIENKNFIEGIFLNREEAGKYLLDHPQKEKCAVKETMADNFPLYIVECNFGKFDYCFTKDELINFIKNINLKKIRKSKGTVFRVDENNDTKTKKREELNITIYVIDEPFINKEKNSDAMGGLKHYHIADEKINQVKNGNIDSLKELLDWSNLTRREIDDIYTDSVLLARALGLDSI